MNQKKPKPVSSDNDRMMPMLSLPIRKDDHWKSIIMYFATLEITLNMNDDLMDRFYYNPKELLKEMGTKFPEDKDENGEDKYEDQIHVFVDNRTLRWPLMIIYSPIPESDIQIIVVPKGFEIDKNWLECPPTIDQVKERNGYSDAFCIFPPPTTDDEIVELKRYQLFLAMNRHMYVDLIDKIKNNKNKCHILYIMPWLDRKVDPFERIEFEDSEIVLTTCT
jgi:hypothetical protein